MWDCFLVKVAFIVTLYGLNHHFASQQQMWILLFKF